MIAYTNVFACPALAPVLMQELRLSHVEVGSFMTAYLLPYSLCALVAGYLSDRFGPKRIIIPGVLLLSTGGLLFSSISSCSQGLSLRILIGVGMALVWNSGFKFIAQWFPPEETAISTSIFSSGIGAGCTLAMILSPIITLTFSWRDAFFLLAILGFFIALIQIFLLKEKLQNSDFYLKNSGANGGKRYQSVIKDKRVWLFSALYFLSLFHLYGTRTWVPSYLVESTGFPLLLSGQFSTVMSFGEIVTPLLAGVLAHKLRRKLPVIVIGFLLGLSTVALCTPMRKPIPLSIILILVGQSSVITATVTVALLLAIVRDEVAGITIGIFSLVGYTGGMLSTIIGGYLVDLTGSYVLTIFIYTLSALTGAIITFILRGVEDANPLG